MPNNTLDPNLLRTLNTYEFWLVLDALPHWGWEEGNNPEHRPNQRYMLCPDFLTPIRLRWLLNYTAVDHEHALIECCRTVVEVRDKDTCHQYVHADNFQDFYAKELAEMRELLDRGGSGILIDDWEDAYVLNEILARKGWKLQRLYSEVKGPPLDNGRPDSGK